MRIKRCCNCFKPRFKSKGSFFLKVMEIYVRDKQNETIKPFDNIGLASVVYYVTHKVMIIVTTLR